MTFPLPSLRNGQDNLGRSLEVAARIFYSQVSSARGVDGIGGKVQSVNFTSLGLLAGGIAA